MSQQPLAESNGLSKFLSVCITYNQGLLSLTSPRLKQAWEQRVGVKWPLTISSCENVDFWERESPGMLMLTKDTLEQANSDKGDSQKASVS